MRLLPLLTLAVLIGAVPAYSFEHHQFSLGVGTNFNMPVTEGDMDDEKDEELSITLAIAAKEELKFNDEWFLRTGLWFQEKSAKLSLDSGLGDIDATVIYASIPVTVQYKASDLISIFGGYVADIRINDYCTGSGFVESCNFVEDSKSVVHNATVGASFNFSQLLTLDVSWQQGLSDVYKDLIKINTLQTQLFLKF